MFSLPNKQLLISVGILVFVIGFFYLLSPARALEGSVRVSIEPGRGVSEIAQSLEDDDIIRSSGLFTLYSFLSGRADAIKPGIYVFEHPPSVPKLVSRLHEGPAEVSVTIFPGATLLEVDDILTEKGVVLRGSITDLDPNTLRERFPWLPENLASLEGFLLPETYRFSQGIGPSGATAKILGTFEDRVLPNVEDRDSILPVITLASLLEKEIPDFEEQRIAASILEKRLAARIPLQIDATVVYAVCGGRFLGCPPLKREDFTIDSPYNTYRVLGLTPSPISNPSADSIFAVLNPKSSPYWYYLSDPKTKKTVFSATLDEHNNNRVKYLR